MSEVPEPNQPATPGERAPDQAHELPGRETAGPEPPRNMLPGRERRRSVIERGFVRVVATGGIVGITTVLGAVLVSQDVAGWIVGLTVGLTAVILAAVLWSSRQL